MRFFHKLYRCSILFFCAVMLVACSNASTLNVSTEEIVPLESNHREPITEESTTLTNVEGTHFTYRFASKEEGIKLLEDNGTYFDGFTQYDLDYRMQKKNATLDEYLAFAREQVLEFSEEEAALISAQMEISEDTIYTNGYNIPSTDEIVFVKTTQAEECFTALIAMKPFEKPGDRFFNCYKSVLIPIDGRDIYYLSEEASNFDEIFGTNTDYVIDPEECLADNFSYAMVYGMDWDYNSPEIIQKIISYLQQ